MMLYENCIILLGKSEIMQMHMAPSYTEHDRLRYALHWSTQFLLSTV